jgi:hypothetical protein
MIFDLTSAVSNETTSRAVERNPEKTTNRWRQKRNPRRACGHHDDSDVGIPISIIIDGT